MIVLDTDLFTLLHSPASDARGRLVLRLEAAADTDEEATVTIISFEEQMRGWMSYISRAGNPVDQVPGYERLRRLLAQYQAFPVLRFDDAAARQFQTLRATYRRANTMDLKIAAVAMVHGGLLLSGNARDFAGVAGLKFEPFRR